MPCYDGGGSEYQRGYSDGNREIDALEKELARLEAVLCGVMRADPTIVDRVDWKEVGIRKQRHMTWWKQHEGEDEARRARRAHAAQQALLEQKLRKQREETERIAKKQRLRKELEQMEIEDAMRKASSEKDPR